MYRESAGIAPDAPAMIYFGGRGKKGFYMDLNDAEQYLDLKSIRAGASKSGGTTQFRLLGNTSIDITKAAADGKSGLEVLIGEGKVKY